MSAGVAGPLTVTVDETRSVSALLQLPAAAQTCFVLAHGAGAGMDHSSPHACQQLGDASIDVTRRRFVRPDRPGRTGERSVKRGARVLVASKDQQSI